MKLKLYLTLLIYFLFLSFVNSYIVTYQSNDGVNFNSVSYYCSLNLESCLSLETNPIYQRNNVNLFSYDFDPTATSVIWKNNIFYCENSRTISSIIDLWGSGSRTVKLETMCPKYFTPAFGNFRAWANNNLVVTIPSSDFNNKDLQGNLNYQFF